jgi:hypothetical protein
LFAVDQDADIVNIGRDILSVTAATAQRQSTGLDTSNDGVLIMPIDAHMSTASRNSEQDEYYVIRDDSK